MSIGLAFSCRRAKTILYGTLGRVFFENEEKNQRFQKYPYLYPRRAEYLLIISDSAQCNNVKVVKSLQLLFP